MEIRSFEWGTFFSDIRKGNFQLYSLTWVGIQDPDIYHYAFHSGQIPPQGANRGGYRNPEFDRLVTEGRREPSRRKRKEIYRKVQVLLAHDIPVFPLWINRNILVRERRLPGFVITPGEDYSYVRDMVIDGNIPGGKGGK